MGNVDEREVTEKQRHLEDLDAAIDRRLKESDQASSRIEEAKRLALQHRGEGAHEVALRWVSIPAGKFTMGCEDGCYDSDTAMPRHVVAVAAFELAATETTNNQYQRCIGRGVCKPPSFESFSDIDTILRKAFEDPAQGDLPVVDVRWTDALTFCAWVGGRLPSEAEWEYAARGGREGLRYPWGNDASHRYANYRGIEGPDQWRLTSPVGSFPANGGLYDMAGNVCEWVQDPFHHRYVGAPADSRAWESEIDEAYGYGHRGGSWASDEDDIRVAGRGHLTPVWGTYDVGFRCARSGSNP